MSERAAGSAGPRPGESDLSPAYRRVVLVEVVVLAGLYWLGWYFG